MKIPHGEHWAIVTERTVTIPGDLRSQTNPGHGYPEYQETAIAYEPFTDEQEFLTVLRERFAQTWTRDTTIGLHVTSTYTYRIDISVQERAKSK